MVFIKMIDNLCCVYVCGDVGLLCAVPGPSFDTKNNNAMSVLCRYSFW